MEIEQLIKDTISKAKKAEFSMGKEDVATFTKIVRGEITFDNVIEPETDSQKLKMWLTLRKWEREALAFPSLYYDYQYNVIKLQWPQGKEDCVFCSIEEEKNTRNRWNLEIMIRKYGVEGVAKNWILTQTDPSEVKTALNLSDEKLKDIIQDMKADGIALPEIYKDYQ